ncbi:MAG: class I SAM-dependent methyltransferase [Deltaproteobacteria bacterium]|nr:class I SAM-dependent methyltransferase [Deltaproteobacteria bacterium]
MNGVPPRADGSRQCQSNYAGQPFARRGMYDHEKRSLKARKILAVLEDWGGDPSRLELLDVSCSTGIMTRVFAGHFGRVTGIDIDVEAVDFANRHQNGLEIRYHVMDALNTSFDSGSFDVIICNQMYEHVADARRLMTEIHRLLKPGGVCYFGATNRLKLVEPHYGNIPFLSIMPKPLASLLLRLLRRADDYYETHLTLWGLRQLVGHFEVIDYTRRVIEDPVRFHATDLFRPESFRQRAALAVLSRAYWLFPGYIWLLKKTS